ncbi:hypothetical protein [Desulfonema ishimotonii]|uniref:hypothetical protein n=1 Tax=Desulfonema ishimotonii TaxID=45657 RepID=UPI000F568C42|nr:hypothetical protein [Desulfonema ishimotonii]
MQFRADDIRDALHSYLDPPLKQIEPEFRRLDAIPTRKALLPGLFIEVREVQPGSVGIGNFLGYHAASGGEPTGEVYGRQYHAHVNADIWLDYTDRAAGMDIMQAVTAKVNELLTDEIPALREHGILSLQVRQLGEIESGSQNDLLPNNMQSTIRRAFQLALICEFTETRDYDTIEKIIITSELA